MKLITLYVGNRLDHVINFDTIEDSVPETYIIEKNDSTDLFAFYDSIGYNALKKESKQPDNNCAIVYQDKNGESALYIKSIIAGERREDEIEAGERREDEIDIDIEFSINYVDQISLNGLRNCGLVFYKETSSKPTMRLEMATTNPVMVNICFKLTTEFSIYEKKLQLCVATKENISDIVLDFGSEASQTGIFKRGEIQNISGIRKLFDEMKERLTVPQPNSDQYVQQDSNEHFFRSVFFANKNLNVNEITQIPELDESGRYVNTEDVIKMLTTQIEAQDLVKNHEYIEIPNVKMTQFGGVDQPKIDQKPILEYEDGFFYRISINHFILNALKNADSPCICLYILMPNVYSQLRVFKHLRWIREDIKEILNKNSSLSNRIKAVELSAISESDASLLGAIRVIEDDNENNISVEGGQYIIIDAGKGTIDFSVINYKTSPKKLYSIYRSGIIGAGNALTYAYLFALMKEYMTNRVESIPGDEDLLSFVKENVLGCNEVGRARGGGDLAELLKLMQAVESYKKAVGTNGSQPDESIRPQTHNTRATNWTQVQIPALTDFIKNMHTENSQYMPLSDDAKKYVTGTINQLVDNVCKSLSILKSLGYEDVKGVIFAGRAFALLDFKKAMIKKLKEKIIANKELTYMRNGINIDQKSVCLYIRKAIKDGQYNNHMVSIPIVLRKESSEGSPKRNNWLTRLQEKLGFGIKNAEKSVWQEARNFIDCREPYNTPGSTENNGMVSGFTLEVKTGDSLMIGGTKYSIPENSGEVTIFFSGDKIYCRYTDGANNKKVTELDEDGVDLRTSTFLFQTLFPNVGKDVTIKLPFYQDAEQRGQEEENHNNNIKFTDENNDNSEDDKANADIIETAEEADDSNSYTVDESATIKARDLANKF